MHERRYEMIKILIVGGKLQGTEAAYLSKKAGYFSILVDKKKEIPASALVDRFAQVNVFTEEKMLELFDEVDIVLPAIEDDAVLHKLVEYGDITQTPVIFDERNYQISSSKQLSNDIFEKLGLPLPGKYPNTQYPIVIKPDDLSGSSHVHKAVDAEEADKIIASMNGKIVIQEFLEGRSFSLEVIGDGENFFFPQITEVVIDEGYDCKRVIAPAEISTSIEEQFLKIAKELASSLKIKGIFDIEVINHHGILKLIEIDARFPSQTPIAVYKSCGINLVECLVELALGRFNELKQTSNKVCYYQQIEVNESRILVIGEHTIASCIGLKLIQGFFGADEAITDYEEGKTHWKAIVMTTADTYQNAYNQFVSFINNIQLLNEHLKYIEG